MIAEVVSSISGIAINVVSSIIYDESKRLLEPRHAEQIKERINKWIEDFFTKHMEVVFESSNFSNYVTYQKPFDKIIDYVIDTMSTVTIGEQDFVKCLTSDCKNHIILAGGKCSINEESTIRELFYGILSLYKSILSEEATDGEKLILYQNRQNGMKMEASLKKFDSKIEDLASLIKQGDRITDSETIKKAYNHFSDAIWDGKITEVHGLLPMLSGKNDDLENALKIKLAILSDFNILITDPLELCHSIGNVILRDDVYRLLILKNFTTPDRLLPYLESISDPTLKKITTSIVTGHLDDVIIKSESVQGNITYYNYKFADGMETEEWLIRRLCVLSLISLPICNLSKTIKDLVEPPNFIDQLYIWEHYFNETFSLDIDGTCSKSKEFRDYVAEMKRSINDYTHAQPNLQKRFYLVLIRSMSFVEDSDIKDILSNMPNQITKFPEIEALNLDQNIKEGNADKDKILGFVLQTKEYWLFVHYCESLGDIQKSLTMINQVKWLVGQSMEILGYAVVITERAKSKKDALDLLKEYEKNYCDYVEFWLSAYWLIENDVDRQWVIDSIVFKMHNGGFNPYNFFAKKELASILIKEKKIEQAIDILNTMEQLCTRNSAVTLIKIEAYMNSGRQIDALTEINKHYDELKDNIQVLDLLFSISLNNKRPIGEEVLSHAKGFDNARVLMLAAEAEYIKKNTDEAKKLAMRSLLISSLDMEELFDIAVKYFLGEESSDNKSSNRIKEDTFFVAENQKDHTRLTFCVYKEKVLPKTEFNWYNAYHIYIDDAISMNFMRLLVGDMVNYDGDLYKIVSIAPIEAFYFNVCMSSMIRRNRALAISGRSAEEMLQGILEIYNQHTDWNKQDWDQIYSDFTQIAFPIYSTKSHINLEYGQLMRVIMNDTSVVVREYIFPNRDYKNREFIITYTALVELHKFGINPMEFYSSIIIPDSVILEAKREADVIYQNNNRDLVASMVVRDNKVMIIESTEDVKRENARQAIDFMNYVTTFKSVENTKDVVFAGLQSEDFAKIIGICDYDAVNLAHMRDAVLVTGEMMVAGLTKLDATKADVAGIADFLCFIGIPVVKLFDVVSQMFKYRFYAAITPTVIIYISKAYNSGDETEKIAITNSWNNILQIPEELADENYRSKFKMACLEIMRLLRESGIDLDHPIIRAFSLASFYYNDYKIEYCFENGSLYYRVVQVGREKMISDMVNSEEN